MKKIYFLTLVPSNGSSFLRGHQVSYFLNKAGYNSSVVSDPSNVESGSIVIIVKVTNQKIIDYLKNKGCIVIYDVIDAFQGGNYIGSNQSIDIKNYCPNFLYKNLDFYIFTNKSMVRDFSNKIENSRFISIQHHYDPRLPSKVSKYDKEKINKPCFIGQRENFVDLGSARVRNMITKVFDFNKMLDECPKYSFHYNVRIKNSVDSYYKPAQKIFTASVSLSNIIQTKEESCFDLIPSDYPYMIDNPTDVELENFIDFCLESYKSEVWNLGLEMIDYMKERYSIESLIQTGYKKLLEDCYE